MHNTRQTLKNFVFYIQNVFMGKDKGKDKIVHVHATKAYDWLISTDSRNFRFTRAEKSPSTH
jgi:hypothetical protein